jgi:hypothetical protein
MVQKMASAFCIQWTSFWWRGYSLFRFLGKDNHHNVTIWAEYEGMNHTKIRGDNIQCTLPDVQNVRRQPPAHSTGCSERPETTSSALYRVFRTIDEWTTRAWWLPTRLPCSAMKINPDLRVLLSLSWTEHLHIWSKLPDRWIGAERRIASAYSLQ